MGFSLGGSGGKDKSKTKTSQDNSLDQWSQAQYGDLSGQVKGLLGANPAQSYGGQLSAGPNAYQTQAADSVKGLLGYKPQQVSAQSFRDADLSAYMNPELDNVVSRSLQGVERNRQMQQVSDSQGATAAGAWGGSRHGVADSLTNEAALRTAGDMEANLRSQAYDRAAGLFNQDRAAQMQADQFNAGTGMQAAQLGLSGAGLLGQLGSDLRAGDQAGLDRLYAEFQRMQDDPFKRSQVLLGLLGNTPMIQDSQGTGKTTSTSVKFGLGFTK